MSEAADLADDADQFALSASSAADSSIIPAWNGCVGEVFSSGTVPHNQGAANWESAAADPETGLLYIPSVTNWWASALMEGDDRSDMRYIAKPILVEAPYNSKNGQVPHQAESATGFKEKPRCLIRSYSDHRVARFFRYQSAVPAKPSPSETNLTFAG